MWVLIAGLVVLVGCGGDKDHDSDPDGDGLSPDDCDDAGLEGFADADGDGFGSGPATCDTPTASTGGDCDDTDPAIHPEAVEQCDGADDDCNGLVDDAVVDGFADTDGDGFGSGLATCDTPTASTDGDCDDTDPAIHPGAVEQCDDADDDCNGLVDDAVVEGFADVDGDGFGSGLATCDTPTASTDDDCDDADPAVHPGAVEQCNRADDDCNDLVDDAVVEGFADVDGDGFGSGPARCDTPAVPTDGDCDDADPALNPGAPEQCDGVDQDCDGVPDDGLAFEDLDADGFGDAPLACTDPTAVAVGGDCDDGDPAVHPSAGEACNGIDDDCDPATPDTAEIAGVGFSSIADALAAAVDGDRVDLCDGTFDVHGLSIRSDLTLTSFSGVRDAAVLDGGGEGSVLTVVGATVTFRSLTVRDGFGDDVGGVPTGGGVNALSGAGGRVTIDDCAFEDNVADPARDGQGGAVAAKQLTVTDSTFDGNAASYGGALWVTGAVAVSGSTFTANTAAEEGGALYGGPPVLTDDTFTENTAGYAGGAVSDPSFGTDAATTGCRFEANTAASAGGAVFASSSGTIDTTVFLDNSSDGAGGALSYEAYGGLALTGTTFDGNSGSRGGGMDVYAVSKACKVTADAATTFVGNRAVGLGLGDGEGGAVSVFGGSLQGGTFTGNHADQLGGAVYVDGTVIWPSIVSGITADGNDAGTAGGGLYLDGEPISVSSSIVTNNEVTGAAGTGGGIAAYDSLGPTLQLTDLTVSGNSAFEGGGLHVDLARVALTDCAVVSNVASGDGGGVYLTTSATLGSTATDFGEDATDNAPDDVFQASGGQSWIFGAAATFACTNAAGCL